MRHEPRAASARTHPPRALALCALLACPLGAVTACGEAPPSPHGAGRTDIARGCESPGPFDPRCGAGHAAGAGGATPLRAARVAPRTGSAGQAAPVPSLEPTRSTRVHGDAATADLASALGWSIYVTSPRWCDTGDARAADGVWGR